MSGLKPGPISEATTARATTTATATTTALSVEMVRSVSVGKVRRGPSTPLRFAQDDGFLGMEKEQATPRATAVDVQRVMGNQISRGPWAVGLKRWS
jgi:hypothetical protein